MNYTTGWVEGYRRAWESNSPDDIMALFTEDAEYRTEPWAAPWRGHEQIVEQWLEAADKPGDTTFEWEILLETETRAVVRGWSDYAGRSLYHNVWLIDFAPDGRATAYTEWWMPEHRDGDAAAEPDGDGDAAIG